MNNCKWMIFFFMCLTSLVSINKNNGPMLYIVQVQTLEGSIIFFTQDIETKLKKKINTIIILIFTVRIWNYEKILPNGFSNLK